MNRTLLTFAGVFSASSLLLVDSAVKGAALLVLAAVAVTILRRDSAATRHLVWLLAIVALLVVPALSALLPQWRVLPEWTSLSSEPVAADLIPVDGTLELPRNAKPVEVAPPSATAHQPAAEPPDMRPALVAPEITRASAVSSWNWTDALPLAWGIGFSVLILRLMAARWMLWNSESRAMVIWLSMRPAQTTDDPIAAALAAVCLQLGISRPVTLLIHPDKTIPVVWGILRCRLLLPAAARQWSGEQLRSVLLHELAHIKRRDTLAQLLTQIACALHWFNPLVWFAAWRLGVERERACDDLVLASGVRPSAYAGHLLDVVTGLSPARWTQSCGLAMARKSSLEGRLVAVLSEKLNRRGVSVALAAIALAIAVGIAVPIAMLGAADEQPVEVILGAADEQPAEKQKPATAVMKPKHEYAQALFKKWQVYARTDGKIPGALIGHVAREIDGYVKQYPQDEKTPKLAALRPRLDAAHDWTQADVVALLDDITAISTAPVSWADIAMDFDDMRIVKPGQPLPVALTTAAWGAPAANGLRAAWLLEPRAEQYALGSVLKARVLFHNTGKEAVVFKTETWHQYDGHKARDAKGVAIKVSGTWYSGITPLATYRLAPGEYCEVVGHGVAIGAGKYEEEFSTGSVGAVIEAKVGDEVTLTHSVDTTHGGWTRPGDPKDPAELWRKNIAERVEREGPMPKASADREQLIRRVTLDVFGIVASAEEIAAFIGDKGPDALAKLTARLQAKERIEPWIGKLPTGATRFRVIAADPNAAKAPRAANAPGRYVLGDRVDLFVSQLTEGSKRTNTARIAFLSYPKVASPHLPYEIALPDGIGTYGIVWERGAGVLWVMQKDLVRKLDFTDPAQVKETRFEPGSIADVPQQLRGTLRKVFDVPGGPVQEPEAPKAKKGAKLSPSTEKRLKWGEPVNGLRAALVIRHSTDEPKAGEKPDLYLVVQNVSDAPIRLSDANVPPNVDLRVLYLKIDGQMKDGLGARVPALGDLMLQPREVAFLLMFLPDSKVLDGHTIGSAIADFTLKDPRQTLVAHLHIEKAPAGAWTGKLRTGETSGAAAAGEPLSKNKEAQALFKMWQDHARKNGDIPGGLVARLGDKVKYFIRINTGDVSGDPYAKKMAPLVPRFDATGDWTPAKVMALLDDIAAVSTIPLETTMEEAWGRTFRTGVPLPKELARAPWGEAKPNGLRMAWLLEPRAAQYRLDTPLKSRILIHNSGKDTVVFRTRSWHQSSGHKASDAKGADIAIVSTYWTTLSRLVPFRLAPGEFVELTAAGIGVGANKNDEDWQNTRVGSWIDAKAEDEVTFTPDAVPLNGWNEVPPRNGEPSWWLDFITTRLARDLPLPADGAERTLMLGRVTRDLFGTAPTAEETAAFVADRNPNALDALAKRLVQRPGFTPFSGPLTSGATKFRVLPADPDAAKKPRTASNPGRYTLGENVRLVVTRRPDGERIVNEASIEFYSKDPTKPHEIKLPDGYNTWAAGWERGKTVLWVLQKSNVRSYDFTNPAQVKETTLEGPANFDSVPRPILDALRAAVDVPGALKPATETPKKKT
jgi:beta-lactamase regulating signal transducer with metallopeptidase domain